MIASYFRQDMSLTLLKLAVACAFAACGSAAPLREQPRSQARHGHDFAATCTSVLASCVALNLAVCDCYSAFVSCAPARASVAVCEAAGCPTHVCDPRVVIETSLWWSTMPGRWRLSGRADPDALVKLTFAVRQKNLHRLDELLHDVAHPASPRYGHHYDARRMRATFMDDVRACLHARAHVRVRVRVGVCLKCT